METNNLEIARTNTRARFEQWAKNPECHANTVSAVLNVNVTAVAKQLGYSPKNMKPDFAIQRGMLFEHTLFKDGAKVLLEALQKKQDLPAHARGFLDLRMRSAGGPLKNSIESIEKSEKFLLNLAKPEALEKEQPAIVSGVTLPLPKGVMLPEATLILDVLTINRRADNRFALKVGEIKIFPDRGGNTEPGHLAAARAQAGIYKHALEDWLDARGIDQLTVEREGFLVFTWPASNFPVVRVHEDLSEQAERARRGFAQMDSVALSVVSPGAEEYDPTQYQDWVAHSQTNFRDSCWGFCELATRCQDLALEANRPILLGNDVARALGSLTLNRALELLNAAGPDSEFEHSLAEQLSVVGWQN
jgi:hypothetical protein